MSDKTNHEIMRVLIPMLTTCDELYLCIDWQDSPNTLVEIRIAKACGIKVFDSYGRDRTHNIRIIK